MSRDLRSPLIWFFVIFALGVRLITVRGDLWLDEIWSIDLVARATAWTDVFTAIHHDNNHYLNSLFIYALGSARPDVFVYRIPALCFSIAALPMAYLTGRSRTERLLTLALVAASYLIAFATTEARGYAPLVFFTLASLATFTRGGPPWAWALAAVGGLLSHLSFIFALAGFAAAYAVDVGRGRRSLTHATVALLPPLILFTSLWFVDLRRLEIGGDAPSAWLGVVRSTAGWLLLGTGDRWPATLAALVLSWGSITAWRRADAADRVLFAVVMVLAPLVVLSVREQSYLAPRYLIVPALFAMVALARALTDLGQKSIGAVIGILLIANARAAARTRGAGRGTYAAAVHYICAREPRAVTTSDHDFRNGLVFRFYARRDGACAEASYRDVTATTPEVDWMIFHSLTPPLPRVVTPMGFGRFVLDHAYEAGDLSGWGWAIYRRVR